MKKGILLLILSIITVSGVAGMENKTKDGRPLFAEPEEAIIFFIESIKERNLNSALGACAVESAAENFDFEVFTDYLQAMVLFNTLAPSDDPMLLDINIIDRIYQISRSVKFFCYSLLATEKNDGMTIPDPGPERIEAFIDSLDTARLKDLEIGKIMFPAPDLENDERLVKSFQKRADNYGADEWTERVAVYKFEDSYYLSGFELARYGKHWQIFSLTSALANTGIMEVITRISRTDYENFLKQ